MRRLLVLILILSAVTVPPVGAGWDEGVAAFTAKNYPQAAEEFQQLVQQNPDGYRGHYMLGLSLEQMGRKEEALHHLRKAYDLNPNEISVQLALGRAYQNVRRYAETAQLLSAVDPSTLSVKQKAAFYQMRGQARYKIEDVEGAVADFEQVAKLLPDDSRAQYLYGTTALSSGRVNAGVDALGRATRLDPNDAEKKRAYVKALIKKGRMTRSKTEKRQIYGEAATVARKLTEKSASYENLMLQVSAELGAGLFKEAVKTGQAAVAKSKNNEWLALYYLGQAYTSVEQFDEAEQPLKQAMKLVSEPADQKTVWKQLGFVYEKQKKYAESISAYQNAGDSASVARVKRNEETELYNRQVEQENQRIREMEEEARTLEEELKKLEGGGGGL